VQIRQGGSVGNGEVEIVKGKRVIGEVGMMLSEVVECP